MGRMRCNSGEDVGEPGLRIDAIHLGRDDEAVHGGRALSAAIGSAEQPGFPAKSNYPSILPMSGRMLKSFIAGMRFMDAMFD
jgi:hypothetical protein